MYNKATKYLYAGNYSKALQFYKKEPLEFKEKYINMGNCYRALGRSNEAFACYVRAENPALPLCDGTYLPSYSLALNNMGLMMYEAGDSLSAAMVCKQDLTEQ